MSFEEERVFYKRDASGGIREWRISVDYVNERLVIRHGTHDGELQVKYEEIFEGKGGRDVDEQLDLRCKSRIRNKKDAGYSENIEDAKYTPTNQLGLQRPMLAQKFHEKRATWENAFVQRKYNGHRCLVTMQDGEKIAYTRKGRLIKTIDHILEGIEIEEGMTIDGELYVHGMSLQKIGSLVKKKQAASLNLRYIVYDIMLKEPYAVRHAKLAGLVLGSAASIAPTFPVSSLGEAMLLFRQFRDEKYEGAMLRHGYAPYEASVRSSSLLKMKEWEDEEFEVVGFKVSRDGWAILICDNGDGKTFDVSAPGTIEEKTEVLENKENYLGKMVTVQFPERTDDGLPSQPTAVAWREDDE